MLIFIFYLLFNKQVRMFVFSRSFECIRMGCEGTFWSIYHLYSAPTRGPSLAVQAGLRTRHITTVAITTACRNAIHSANRHWNVIVFSQGVKQINWLLSKWIDQLIVTFVKLDSKDLNIIGRQEWILKLYQNPSAKLLAGQKFWYCETRWWHWGGIYTHPYVSL